MREPLGDSVVGGRQAETDVWKSSHRHVSRAPNKPRNTGSKTKNRMPNKLFFFHLTVIIVVVVG